MSKKQTYKEEVRSKKRKAQVIAHILWSIAAVFFVFGAMHILFFARMFDIRVIDLKMPAVLSQEEVKKVINEWLDDGFWKLTRRNNSILFSFDGLKFRLEQNFLRIANVKVEKRNIHELEIEITNRKAVGVWCLSKQDNCYLFDAGGIAFLETKPSSGSLFAIVDDRRDIFINLGSNVAPSSKLDSILLSRRLLQFGGLGIRKYIIEPGYTSNFDIITAENWKIFLSGNVNINKQISAMFSVLKTKITPEERSKLDYIDLRVPNRVDYKTY